MAAGPRDRHTHRSSALAIRQSVFREVNELIEGLDERTDMFGPLAALCECGHPSCRERIQVSREEYESVRRFPTRFLVVPGHQRHEDERVVETHTEYVVTEKFGRNALTSIQCDPRTMRRRDLHLREKRTNT
jgi:hypothetical protein